MDLFTSHSFHFGHYCSTNVHSVFSLRVQRLTFVCTSSKLYYLGVEPNSDILHVRELHIMKTRAAMVRRRGLEFYGVVAAVPNMKKPDVISLCVAIRTKQTANVPVPSPTSLSSRLGKKIPMSPPLVMSDSDLLAPKGSGPGSSSSSSAMHRRRMNLLHSQGLGGRGRGGMGRSRGRTRGRGRRRLRHTHPRHNHHPHPHRRKNLGHGQKGVVGSSDLESGSGSGTGSGSSSGSGMMGMGMGSDLGGSSGSGAESSSSASSSPGSTTATVATTAEGGYLLFQKLYLNRSHDTLQLEQRGQIVSREVAAPLALQVLTSDSGRSFFVLCTTAAEAAAAEAVGVLNARPLPQTPAGASVAAAVASSGGLNQRVVVFDSAEFRVVENPFALFPELRAKIVSSETEKAELDLNAPSPIPQPSPRRGLVSLVCIEAHYTDGYRLVALGDLQGRLRLTFRNTETHVLERCHTVHLDSPIASICFFRNIMSKDVVVHQLVECVNWIMSEGVPEADERKAIPPMRVTSNHELNLVVGESLGRIFVFWDIARNGLTNTTIVKDSNDSILCVYPFDISGDGAKELLVGTYSQSLLVYRLTTELVEGEEDGDVPVMRHGYVRDRAYVFDYPVYCVDSIDFTNDGTGEIIVCSQKNLTLMQQDLQLLNMKIQEKASKVLEIFKLLGPEEIRRAGLSMNSGAPSAVPWPYDQHW